MVGECRVRSLQLRAANICIRVCGGEAEVSISPLWDTIGRHEYIAAGTAEEVLKELRQLAEDTLKAAEELESMAREAGSRNHSRAE